MFFNFFFNRRPNEVTTPRIHPDMVDTSKSVVDRIFTEKFDVRKAVHKIAAVDAITLHLRRRNRQNNAMG